MSEPMPAPEDVVLSWGCICPDDEGHDPESGCRYGQPRGVSVHAWREQAEQLHTTRQRLADLERDARNVLSCLHASNVTTAESLLRHALDQDTARDGDP